MISLAFSQSSDHKKFYVLDQNNTLHYFHLDNEFDQVVAQDLDSQY
jgi:hypothetical protein